jgi:hypothetical protein
MSRTNVARKSQRPRPERDALERRVLRKKLALVDLIDYQAACALVSIGGERGMRFAKALDALNDALDALQGARVVAASESEHVVPIRRDPGPFARGPEA